MIAMTFFPLWQKADLETSRLITMNAFEIRFEQQTAAGNNGIAGCAKRDVDFDWCVPGSRDHAFLHI